MDWDCTMDEVYEAFNKTTSDIGDMLKHIRDLHHALSVLYVYFRKQETPIDITDIIEKHWYNTVYA